MTEISSIPGAPENPPDRQRVNILLVDDRPANLLALEVILQDLGYNLVKADSGAEAVQCLSRDEFAVVLLDVQMPGLDGFETAALMRADNARRVPIIFLTAYSSDRFSAEQAYSLGAVDFLVKPLSPIIVRAKVAGFVELLEKTQQIKRQAEQLQLLERQRFDRSMDEQREWFRVTLSSIGDAVITTDTQGRVTFLNAVAEELTGWTAAGAKGLALATVFPILHEQTEQPIDDPVHRVLSEGRVVGLGNHTVLVARNGTVKPIDDSAAPIRDSNGSLVGVVLIFRDVTEQRRAERAVRQSEARKSAILETALDCIITMDHEGKVVEFNPAAEKTFGYRSADVVGRELASFIIPPALRESHRNGMAHYLSTGSGPVLGKRIEMPALRADQTEFPVELTITRIAVDGPPLFTAYLRDISERTRAEAAQRQAERRFQSVFNQQFQFMAILASDGTVLEANESCFQVTGVARERVLGRPFWEMPWCDRLPAMQEQWKRHISEAASGGGPVKSEFEYVLASGTIRHATGAVTGIKDESGRVTGIVVEGRDDTERQQTEAALRVSEQKMRLMADTIPQLAWMARPDGHIFWYNQRWYDYTGTTPTEMEGWGWQSVHDPVMLPKVLERWQASIASGAPFDMVFPLKGQDGQFRPFLTRINPLRNDEGQILYWFGTNTDISEIKEMEAALRENEARLRAIFEGSLDVIVMTDNEGRYVEANPAASVLFGLPRHELLGRHVADFAEPGFPFDQAWQLFRGSGRSTGEFRLVRPDGTVRDVEFAATADILPGRHLSILRDVTARIQAERALREAETRFAAVINHSPSCIFVKDRQGRYLLANRALAQMVGRELDDFLGRTDADFFPPEIVAQFGKDDADILKDGRPRIYEESFPHAGTTMTALTVKFPLRDMAGSVYGVCGIATDISAQKRANDALAVSEERLRLALEAGQMGVWDWNLRTNEITWSDSLEPIHGLAPGTFGGTMEAFQKLVHPDDRERVAGAIGRAVAERSGYEIEFRNVWPDGSAHWIAGQGKVFTGENGQPVRMIGVGMEVTQRKRSEQTARFLASASSTLAALVDYKSTLQKVAALAVPFFADWATVDIVEDDGSLRRVAVAHVDPSKVELAHEVNRRYPPDPAAPRGLWNILRTGQSEVVADITDELLLATVHDAELLRILRELGLKSYLGVPLIVRGQAIGVITFVAAESGRRYDATDLSVAEDLAHRAGIAIENARLYRELKEADRKKDEFLAVLAHELRNPLAPLSNALQIMRLTALDGPAAQVRDMMDRQVRQMTRLVDDLLDVSRIATGKIVLRKERVDLSEVMLSALETSRPLIEAATHRLTVTPPPPGLLVDGDKARLAQVLSNLLTNSSKYTPEGGQIWLVVERRGQEAVMRVRDNGIGVPADMLPKIFDMFTQVDRNLGRSQGGLGIGLTLVRSLVEMHGGKVEAHSEGPGRGSEFTVRLPLAADNPHSQRVDTDQDAVRQAVDGLSRRRILVVDDNVDSAESLALMLKLRGNDVRTAHNGPQALVVAVAFSPDVVLLDIGMPGMDGYEVARRMRQIGSLQNIVLIAQRGWGQEGDRRRSTAAGFDHHFVKPLDAAALESVLASLPRRMG